jgi:hypothetical protein
MLAAASAPSTHGYYMPRPEAVTTAIDPDRVAFMVPTQRDNALHDFLVRDLKYGHAGMWRLPLLETPGTCDCLGKLNAVSRYRPIFSLNLHSLP